jgi:C-terminal processing protease CtpA/Prc
MGALTGCDPLYSSFQESPGQMQTVTTVGLIVKNATIENLLIGGPAMISEQLARGDKILKVDGRDVENDDRETLLARLVGQSQPPSTSCRIQRYGMIAS